VETDVSTTLQIQARALGDPTRHDIFQFLIDAASPVTVAELTEHFGLNHNAIRQHLTKLVSAGLAVESTAPPTGRGRPHLLYGVDPASESRWGGVGPYERLAVMLAEVVRSGDGPIEVGRRFGARQRVGDEAHADPLTAILEQMARQGFEPSVRHEGDRVDLTFRSCPFISAVVADPASVCDLHLGLAQGAAEAIGGIVVEELVSHDPGHSPCQLRCRVDAG
jgi:predicted ArsR family transcriptional regulator